MWIIRNEEKVVLIYPWFDVVLYNNSITPKKNLKRYTAVYYGIPIKLNPKCIEGFKSPYL